MINFDSYQIKGREIKVETTGFRKRIKGLGPNALFKFNHTQKDGTSVEISIKDYIKQQYNKDIK